VLLEETGGPDLSTAPMGKEAKPTAKTADTTKTPVGKPSPKPADPPKAALPKNLYERIIGLMVKHHAHPVSVHFPNGILPAAVMLFVLAWMFNVELFVKAGFINLIFVVLALPLVLFSGIIEWKKRYNQALTTLFKIKMMAAALTTSTCLISVVWYLIDPNVLSSPKGWVFILVNLVMLASAGIAGHIGGKLVFKD
jgi:uncharacterized membrane protein